jgi:hypothetical protein
MIHPCTHQESGRHQRYAVLLDQPCTLLAFLSSSVCQGGGAAHAVSSQSAVLILALCVNLSTLLLYLPQLCGPCVRCGPCCLQGILYEDTALQVGLQSRYTRSTGELLLFLGNKQAGQPLSGVSLLLSAPSPAVQVVLGAPPPQLAPKQQVQVSTLRACGTRHSACLCVRACALLVLVV